MSNVTCTIVAGDFVGIGVRSAIYGTVTLGFILALAMSHTKEALLQVVRPSFVISAALIFAGTAARNSQLGLSLFDGLCITTLTFLPLTLNIVTEILCSEAFDGSLIVPAVLMLSLSILWTLFGGPFWLTANGLSAFEQEGCSTNSEQLVVIWLFGTDIPVTGLGIQRAFASLIIIIGLFSSLGLLLGPKRLWMLLRFPCGREEPEAELGSTAPQTPRNQVNYGRRIFRSLSSKWTLIPVVFTVFLYQIVGMEKILGDNEVQRQAPADWTFGQVLAIGLLVDQVLRALEQFLLFVIPGLPDSAILGRRPERITRNQEGAVSGAVQIDPGEDIELQSVTL